MSKIKDTAKPTLEDIAARSEVSLATVSRVINQSRPVSKELETRVKKAMTELGFEPKPPKVQTVAIIVPQILNPFLTAVITGAQEEADKSGLGLMILTISEKSQEENLKLLRHFNFDGIILMHPSLEPDDVFALFPQFSLPMVVIYRFFHSPKIHCINTDRETGKILHKNWKKHIILKHNEVNFENV